MVERCFGRNRQPQDSRRLHAAVRPGHSQRPTEPGLADAALPQRNLGHGLRPPTFGAGPDQPVPHPSMAAATRGSPMAGASAEQGRRWDASCADGPGEDHPDLVREAVRPVLAGLQRTDQEMVGSGPVRAGVPVRAAVAAAHVPAGKADAQMHPLAADAQAVMTPLDCLGEHVELDLVEMSAADHGVRRPRRWLAVLRAPRRGRRTRS